VGDFDLAVESDPDPGVMESIFLVKVDLPNCQQCSGALDQFWDSAGAAFPGQLWRTDCTQHPTVSACILAAGQHRASGAPVSPVFVAWDGVQWRRYNGERSLEPLVTWIKEWLATTPERGAPSPSGATVAPLAAAPCTTADTTAALVRASGDGRLREVRRLAFCGVSVSLAPSRGLTPLQAAAYSGRVEVVRFLLNGGATSDDAWTPLRLATAEGHFDGVLRLLIEAGAASASKVDEPKTCGGGASNSGAKSPEVRPRIIHLTQAGRSDVPDKVWAMYRRFAPDHEVRFYDSHDCLSYLTAHWPQLVDTYTALRQPTDRVALFQYAVLYREGGLYFDVRVVLVRPVDEVFPAAEQLYMVRSKNEEAIHQGIIASPPRHPLFQKLLKRMLATGVFRGEPSDYASQAYVAAQPPEVMLYTEHCFDVGQGGCTSLNQNTDCCTVRDDEGRVAFVT
jgi:hypothetical protein